MSPWPAWAWLFWVSGAGTGLLAIIALYRGLWHDPRAGTRRCRGCGYDMTGLPGLVCPECGRAARSERVLIGRRRSWRWSLAGLLMAMLGAASGAWPKVQRDGWWTVTPSTVLIVMWPEWVPNVGLPGRPGSQRASVADMVAWQLGASDLWGWQRSLLASHCARALERDRNDWRSAENAIKLLQTKLVDERSGAMPAVARFAGRMFVAMAGTPSWVMSQSEGWRDLLREWADADESEAGPSLGEGPGDSRVQSYWSGFTGLVPQDPVVVALAAETRQDPYLVPDRVLLSASNDPFWQPWRAPSLYSGMLVDAGRLTRFERIIRALCAVGRAPDLSSVLGARLDADSSWVFRRAGYRIILSCGAMSGGLESRLQQRGLMGRRSGDRELLWLGAIERHTSGDSKALEAWLVDHLRSDHTDLVRNDAAEIAGVTCLDTEPMIAALEGLSADPLISLQTEAADALARLATRSRSALDALRRIRDKGPEWASRRAGEALSRRPVADR